MSRFRIVIEIDTKLASRKAFDNAIRDAVLTADLWVPSYTGTVVFLSTDTATEITHHDKRQ